MRARGFTLIEVVIAMFIAAIMFAIGYGAINQALVDRDALNVSQERVTEIQRGMRVVAQDFAQVVARGARDTSGTGELMPAMLATRKQRCDPHVHARRLEQPRRRSASRRATRALSLHRRRAGTRTLVVRRSGAECRTAAAHLAHQDHGRRSPLPRSGRAPVAHRMAADGAGRARSLRPTSTRCSPARSPSSSPWCSRTGAAFNACSRYLRETRA